MDLKMFLGNKLVDTTKINIHLFNTPGYIEHLKIDMKDKNDDIIDLSNEEPRFFIEPVPSLMNSKRFQQVD